MFEKIVLCKDKNSNKVKYFTSKASNLKLFTYKDNYIIDDLLQHQQTLGDSPPMEEFLLISEVGTKEICTVMIHTYCLN